MRAHWYDLSLVRSLHAGSVKAALKLQNRAFDANYTLLDIPHISIWRHSCISESVNCVTKAKVKSTLGKQCDCFWPFQLLRRPHERAANTADKSSLCELHAMPESGTQHKSNKSSDCTNKTIPSDHCELTCLWDCVLDKIHDNEL
jgi:hypothetical protein